MPQKMFGDWTIYQGGTAAKGLPKAWADKLSHERTALLIKGDPDSQDARYVHMEGETGMDPALVLDFAKREAVFEEMREAGAPLDGVGDDLATTVIRYMQGAGKFEQATFMADFRARQRERSAANAMMAAATTAPEE